MSPRTSGARHRPDGSSGAQAFREFLGPFSQLVTRSEVDAAFGDDRVAVVVCTTRTRCRCRTPRGRSSSPWSTGDQPAADHFRPSAVRGRPRTAKERVISWRYHDRACRVPTTRRQILRTSPRSGTHGARGVSVGPASCGQRVTHGDRLTVVTRRRGEGQRVAPAAEAARRAPSRPPWRRGARCALPADRPACSCSRSPPES